MTIKYGALTAQNPEWMGPIWSELEDLYVGGYRVEQHAKRYLPQVVGEHALRYADRLKSVAYINYFGQAVDSFVSALFSKDIAVSAATDADDPSTIGKAPTDEKFWQEFGKDADRCGNAFAKLLRAALGTALVKRVAYVACDFPAIDEHPATRADEDAAGAARGYCFEVAPDALLDWECDDRGRFVWAIIHRTVATRPAPEVPRGKVAEEFKVWRDVGGVVTWELYRTEPRTGDRAFPAEYDVPQVVPPQRTSFKQIPIVRLELPEGLWVGNKIGPLAREHFQRRSALVAAENKSLFAIPVAKLAPEIGAPGGAHPSEAQQDPHRGNDPIERFRAQGWLTIGAEDSLEFAEPAGGAYTIVDDQLKALVDEMFRVVHQMASSVSSTANAVGRSGDSKAEDRHSTEVVLNALGSFVRDFAQRIYSVIGEARGEDVVWTAHGLDGYEMVDLATLLQEALQVDAVSIPSVTFKRLYKKQIARGLLKNVEPSTLAAIDDEIERGVEEEVDLEDAMHEQKLEMAANPIPPPPPPGQKPAPFGK